MGDAHAPRLETALPQVYDSDVTVSHSTTLSFNSCLKYSAGQQQPVHSSEDKRNPTGGRQQK